MIAVFAHGVCSTEVSQEMDARAKLEEAAEIGKRFAINDNTLLCTEEITQFTCNLPVI